MNNYLPKDLKEAEQLLLNSVITSLRESNQKYLSAFLKFEGLRISPPAYRLSRELKANKFNSILVWADEGSPALAKRDYPDYSDYFSSYNRFMSSDKRYDNDLLVIAIEPQPYDYDKYESLCRSHSGRILMINGKLEDTMVGIGTVARKRRKDFIMSWDTIFSLEPFNNGAIMKCYPNGWDLFKLTNEGYIYIDTLDNKPTSEQLFELIGG